MSEPTPEPPKGRALKPAGSAGTDAALPDGGRRAVVVSPDEVWTAPEPRPQAPGAVRSEARRSFFAPILMVGGLSTLLLVLFMAALALLVWLRR